MPAWITGPFRWISPVSCGEERARLSSPTDLINTNAPARPRSAHRLLRSSTPVRYQIERESMVRPHGPHAYEGPRRVFFLYSFRYVVRGLRSPCCGLVRV